MALPTITKTWDHTSWNIHWASGGSSWGTHRRLWRFIKDTLISWGWTCVGSCGYIGGGLQYGLDGVDRWSTDGNLKWSDYYDNCTWMLLRRPNAGGPGKNFDFMWQTTNGGYQACWQSQFLCSFDPCVGGTGAWNNPPKPASGNYTIRYANSYSGWYYGSTCLNIGDEEWDGIVHAIRSTDNAVQRFIVCRNNSVVLYIAFEQVETDVISGWTHPFIFTWCRYPMSYGYLNDDCQYTVAYNNGRWLELYYASEGYGGGTLGENIAYRNEITDEGQMAPVTLISNTAYCRTRYGRLTDIWWANTDLRTGDTIPGNESAQYAVFNNLIVPAGGAAPFTV